MKIYMIACSRKAYECMEEWKGKWIVGHGNDDVRCIVKCSALAELSDVRSLREIAGEAFREADALVFFCAVGIAVRSIAPFLQHKSEDIAVLAVDELGKFCIPILSGHAGGANALAAEMAELSGAVLVVTTATDLEGKFAVDDFARKNNLAVTDWKLAKEISVRILTGERVEFCSELPVTGEVPKELKIIPWGKEEKVQERKAEAEKGKNGEEKQIDEEQKARQEERSKKPLRILVTNKRKELEEAKTVLQLVPRRIAVGIGCRKGTTQEKIRAAVVQCLEENDIRREAVFAVASIDLKKNETGLEEYCRAEELPFLVFGAEQLKKVQGSFTESDFVKKITGVENVCEKSAVCAVWQKTGGELKRSDAADLLLCRKRVYGGVTVALAEQEGGLCFE